MEEKGLVVRKENLPATIEELKAFVIVTKRRIEAHKAQISAIKRLGLSKSVYERKLKETQYMSGIVLWAEAKMGSLLKIIPRAEGGTPYKKKYSTSNTGVTSRTEIQKSEERTGIKKMERSRAQILDNNREVIQEVIEEEERKKTLPTREKVFRRIREKKAKSVRTKMRKQAKDYMSEGKKPKVICADFYGYCMKNVKPNSIDHIITDPPYSKEFLYLYSQLSEVAQKVLKPSGFCIVYVGTYFLDEVMDRMREHGLEYYWQICLELIGSHAKVYARSIYQAFRGVLIFQKKPIEKMKLMTMDFIKIMNPEKELHLWQRSVREFVELLNKFTEPKQMILEPFAGAGTVGVACVQAKRKCILIDNDKGVIDTIKGRLNIAYNKLDKTK